MGQPPKSKIEQLKREKREAKAAKHLVSGKIVAEADRFIDPDTIILRTVQYGLGNYPELDKEGHWQRTLDHLNEI